MIGPEDVLSFWLDEVGPDGWYKADETLDAKISETFEAAWEGAMDGKYSLWLTYPSGALAYIILTDQFPRNMFRGSGRAFASDRAALTAAKAAIGKGWDMRIDEPARQFFYLPLMHSENLVDPERCMACFKDRMPKMGADNLRHAAAHRWIIKRYGRFPYRNAALGRETTSEEAEFMRRGGYATLLDAA